MIHAQEIWDCIKKHLPKDQWTYLDEIYRIIEKSLALDDEDYEWQSPSSDTPKWKRNVRNVLQYRRGTDEIDWDR